MTLPEHASTVTASRHGRSRRRVLVAASAAAALVLAPVTTLPAAASPAAAPGADSSGPASGPEGTGLPSGASAAALAAEPALPEASGWDFSEDFARTSGTGRYEEGAYLWTDWLYDDTGAGDFTYDDPDATGSNGADVFRAAIAVDDSFSYWRIDWNTLIDPDVPIAAWTFDTDGDAATGVEEWPAAAGARSPGMDASLVVSSRGAWVTDLETGEETDVTAAGGELTVDTDARSFVVAVPRAELPVDGTWTTRLAAGLADETGRAFRPAPQSGEGTRIYNAAFRDMEDEPHLVGDYASAATHWNNGGQSEHLKAGDLSAFALDVDWAALESGVSTPEAAPTGYSTRWYASSVEIAQGRDAQARKSPGPGLLPATFWGRVQPYTVYVPSTYSADDPVPLTILMHGGDANHNGFLGSSKEDVYGPMCEDRGSICVTPLGRGLSSWYINHSELDVWEVWNRVAHAYSLDSESTVIGGFSMGGVGATRFITNYSDLFAGAVIASGAGYYNSPGERDREDAALRVENLGHVKTFMASGSEDISLANTRMWDSVLQDSGMPYQANYYDGAGHGDFTWLGWAEAAQYLSGQTRATDPAEIIHRWEPGDDRPDLGMDIDSAYWLTGLAARDESARWSRATATSGVLKTTEYQPEHSDTVQTIDGRAVNVREQQLIDLGPLEPHNEIALGAMNVAALEVDLDRAQLAQDQPGTVRLSTDGAVSIALARSETTAAIELDAGDHELTSPSAPEELTAETADGAVALSWSESSSLLPDTVYTVQDDEGTVLCTTATTACLIEGLTHEPHTFFVSASNIVGTSSQVATPEVTPGPEVPVVPENFTDNEPGSRHFAPVRWMQEAGLTNGYSDGSFGKDREISRGESLAFVYRYLDPSFTPEGEPFSDVTGDHTHYEPIAWAQANEISQGYVDGEFKPAREVTRGEFASFLYRAVDPEHLGPEQTEFSDVPTGDAAYQAITWLASEGLSVGYSDGSYRSDRHITRAEVATLLYRYETMIANEG